MIYTTVTDSEDITEEILSMAESIFDGWFAEASAVDWTDFFDRLDGMGLEDGTALDLGDNMSSPAIKKIKTHIRAYKSS